MDEVKNTQIQIRISPNEKQKITEQAKKKGMSVSEFIRWACEKAED